jgi:hypothetical protein
VPKAKRSSAELARVDAAAETTKGSLLGSPDRRGRDHGSFCLGQPRLNCWLCQLRREHDGVQLSLTCTTRVASEECLPCFQVSCEASGRTHVPDSRGVAETSVVWVEDAHTTGGCPDPVLGLRAPTEDQRPYRWTKSPGHPVTGAQAHGHLEVRKSSMLTQRNQRRRERQHPPRPVVVPDRLDEVRPVTDEVALVWLGNGIGTQPHSCHVGSGTTGTPLTALPILSPPAGAATFDHCAAPRTNG